MADRICSCCGEVYTDDARHDYEQCIKRCEESVATARSKYHSALDSLDLAKHRLQLHREGTLK